LPLDDFLGLVGFSLLERFTNTGNDTQTSLDGSLDLLGDKLVSVTEHGSSLRVTEDDPVDLSVLELVGGDFTSEGSRGGSEAVLGRDLGRSLQSGLDVEKVDGRGSNNDL
jgi:hypothetical protein